jgi:hypothetical protein
MIFKRAAFLGDKKEIENEIIKKKKKRKKHTPMFFFFKSPFPFGHYFTGDWAARPSDDMAADGIFPEKKKLKIK